ncbi:MAG: glycosyltransferase [bacterium]|nr:glycosyltransferase [bacterium]
MRVLLITTTFLPAYGGVERLLAHLFGDRKDIEADVLTEPGSAVVAGWKLIRTPLLTGRVRPRWFGTFKSFKHYTEKHDYDVIVLGHYAPYLAAALRCRSKFGTKVVVITHGMDVLSYDTAGGLRRWWLRRHLPSANLVIANSKFTDTHLKRLGVPESRRTILTPGADIPATIQVKPDARATLGLPLDAQVLLTVGRLVPRKGHLVAIDAFAALAPRYPNLHYYIVGRGTEEGKIRQRIAALALEDRIHVLNNVEDTSVVYAAADLFLFPSVPGENGDVEGYGLVSVEAQAHGLPVLASNTGGIPETISPGITGELVEPGEADEIAKAIEPFLKDPLRLQRYSDRAKKFANEQFSWETRRRRIAELLHLITDMPKVKISVVIPAFNSARIIARTLTDLQAQTLKPAEIVVVDDGSTDNTSEIAKKFDVQLVAQENKGAPAARNVGFAKTTGDFVLYCDADVELQPTMLENMARALLLHPEAGYAYSDFKFGWHTFDLFDFDPERLLEANYISTMSLLRREHCIGFDESLKRYQDWDLWKRLLSKGVRGIWVPGRLFNAGFGGISKDSAKDVWKLTKSKL